MCVGQSINLCYLVFRHDLLIKCPHNANLDLPVISRDCRYQRVQCSYPTLTYVLKSSELGNGHVHPSIHDDVSELEVSHVVSG